MQLVKSSVHREVGHTGGHSFTRKALGTVVRTLESPAAVAVGTFLDLPGAVADSYYKGHSGYGAFEYFNKPRDERRYILACRAGNCT